MEQLVLSLNVLTSVSMFQIRLHKFAAIEVHVLSTLGHPNIVQFYGLLCQGPEVYILMEYVDGRCLWIYRLS